MTRNRDIHQLRFQAGATPVAGPDSVAVEEPLEVRLEGKPLAVIMRTPGHDRELVAGFFLSEGLAATPEDFFEINACPSLTTEGGAGNAMDVILRAPADSVWSRLSRHVFSGSSCGICGKASIESILAHVPTIDSRPLVRADVLTGLPGRMRKEQEVFATTGGIHAAALFDTGGNLLALREDVGRHNAVDKLLGWALLERKLPLRNHLMLVSGRTSFEIVQKALAGGVPVVAAISAPSSLAIELARNSGVVLIGFLRGDTFNVYSHESNIQN